MKNICSSRRRGVLCWIVVAALLALSGSENNTWAFGSGAFQGILQSDSNNDESFGFMTLILNGSGTFSMNFNLGVNGVGHHRYAMSGKFDESGHYHFEGPDPHDTRYAVARIIDLQLDSVDNPTKVNGDVTDLTHSSTIELEKVHTTTLANSAPEAGQYTFLFSSGDSGVPNGNGFGRAVINRLGHIVAAGRTPDGRAFSQAANVTVYDRWPVFAKTASVTNGILSGWLSFNQTLFSDFSGQLTWIGPEVPGPNHAFVPEFSGNVNVSGSRYIPGGTVLDVSSSSNNVGLSLTGGGLEASIDRSVTLTSNNKFIFSPRLAGDSLVVNPATGLFAGTFKHSDGRIYTFRGAIHQKQNRGAGEFIDIERETGNVTLTPQ